MLFNLFYVNKNIKIFLLINFFISLFSLDIISWFSLQIIPNEKKFENFLELLLIVSVNLNSFMFFFSFLFFVYLLKDTLEQITMELKIKHPEEYYIDYNNCNKNML